MTFSRRGFVRRAAGVAGGLLFADVVGIDRLVGSANAQSEALPGDEVDPNFLEAEVQSIRGDTITAMTGNLATRLVRVSAKTRIWRTALVTLSDLRPGDVFYARGTLDDDGYLNADSIWSNIVNFTGSVSLVRDGSTGELILSDHRVYHVHFAPAAEVHFQNVPVQSAASLPSELAVAQVLGMWDEQSQSLEVTKLWT